MRVKGIGATYYCKEIEVFMQKTKKQDPNFKFEVGVFRF